MKLSAIQVKFETSKYLALKRYAAKKEVSLEQELEETLNRLYRKLVPPDVREYLKKARKWKEQVNEKRKTKKKNLRKNRIKQNSRRIANPFKGKRAAGISCSLL